MEEQFPPAELNEQKIHYVKVIPVPGKPALNGIVVFRDKITHYNQEMTTNGGYVERVELAGGAKLYQMNAMRYTIAGLECDLPKKQPVIPFITQVLVVLALIAISPMAPIMACIAVSIISAFGIREYYLRREAHAQAVRKLYNELGDNYARAIVAHYTK